MIVFSMSLFVPSSQHADLARTLAALLEPVRAAPGCLRCQLYTDFEDANGFLLVEEWDSPVMLERHLQSDACKTLLAALELSTRPPAIRFDQVARRDGIEVIEAARCSTTLQEISR
jgi:quinol monooxygenase YgiN